MFKAPFEEPPVADVAAHPASSAARKKVEGALKQFDAAGGTLDRGDGAGRHANREKKQGVLGKTPGRDGYAVLPGGVGHGEGGSGPGSPEAEALPG